MSRNNHSKTRRTQVTRTQGTTRAGASSPATPRTQRTGRALDALAQSGIQERVGTELQAARDMLTKTGEAAMKAIKANPMPLALTGLGVACAGAGLAWLLSSTATSATNGASAPTGMSAKSAVGSKVSAASAKASRLAHDVAMQSRKLEQSVEGAVKEHPLAIGAAIFAAGAAVGLAIPRSKLEDGWLGRERDQIVRSAQQIARGAAQKVESFAKEMVSPNNAHA